MTIGSVLQNCRERAGLSQRKLAEMMQRTQSCISKFEQDHKLLNMVEFRQWMQLTNAGDVGVAFMAGLDPAAILQTVLQVAGVA